MPTCNVTINGVYDSTTLINDQPVQHTVNTSNNSMFNFRLANNQSVFFSTNYEMTNSSSQTYSLTITVFNKDYQTVGNIKIIQQVTNFSIDLLEGEYTICVRALIGTYTGSIMAKFVGYSRNVYIEPELTIGQELSFDLTLPKVERLCTQPLIYEFVDGDLPPNIRLLASGQLIGTAPILDCLDDNNYLPPSSNLYYDAGEGDSNSNIQSWERHYRFRAKVYLRNAPENFAIDQFCISIVPDWSRTDKRFNNTYTDINTVHEITVNERIKEIDLCSIKCVDGDNDNNIYDATIAKINKINTNSNMLETRLPKDENGYFIDKHVDNLIIENLDNIQNAYTVLEEMIYESVNTENKDINSIINYTIDNEIEVVDKLGTFAENELLFIPNGMINGEVFEWVEKHYYDIEYPYNMSDEDINEWLSKYKEPIKNLSRIINEYRDSILYNRYRDGGGNVVVSYFENTDGKTFCDLSMDNGNDVKEMQNYNTIHDKQFDKVPTTPRYYDGTECTFDLRMGG